MSNKKCTIQGGRIIVPCKSLDEEVDDIAPTGCRRGLYQWTFTNRRTGAERTLFGLKTSHSPKGVIFNYCPWCGTDMQEAHP